MNTAGRAILFAGATVVVALLGMFALGVSFLYGAAIAASLGVLLVLAASLTLLPALLMFTGRPVGRVRSRRTRPREARAGFWLRWVGLIQRRPVWAAIAVYPTTSPQSAQTTSLVKRLRNEVLPPVAKATGTAVDVGGATATQVDFAHVLAGKLPLFIGLVVLVSALLLLIVFRSVLIPVQAALMNLLSIA